LIVSWVWKLDGIDTLLSPGSTSFVEAAKQDVFLRVVGQGSDGNADPAME
jgi:hypothetical protein